MAPEFPGNLEPFDAAKVPKEAQLGRAKLMKLLLLGLMVAFPVIGLLLSVPYLQALHGQDLYIFTAAIPFAILVLMSVVFAYTNRKYGTQMQYYAAWSALVPVLESLDEKPSRVLVSTTSFAEACAAGVRAKEFVLRFAAAPEVNFYYHDGSVCTGATPFASQPKEFYGLRLRALAQLKQKTPGRFERYGTIYLPQWGFTDEVRDLDRIWKKVDLSNLSLVAAEPEPSRIQFFGDYVIIVLSLKKGAQKQVWKAAQAIIQILNALGEEGVV